ncbi:MAG: hypothetical protein GYA55_11110 [SAR324 cluster bacterium]|uniref:Prepilin-type N-terminal cleavage/methylation domain-containing protein n=1 Tax=SAR324 cluster bacterium TaxID=2024889 RepID=A0A7X9IKH4_9DELT|nr:hypothetical protein [SAR324 cluster bacterium]
MSIFSRAYTLLEMCIVLCLVAIFLGAGTLSLKANIQSQRLKAEAKHMVVILDSLSLEARQKEKDIHLDINETGYAGYRDKICFLQGSLPKPLKFSEGSSKALIFLRNGVSSPGTLRLSDGKKTCLIVVSLRGRVRSQCL